MHRIVVHIFLSCKIAIIIFLLFSLSIFNHIESSSIVILRFVFQLNSVSSKGIYCTKEEYIFLVCILRDHLEVKSDIGLFALQLKNSVIKS
jgi:hypothetical protein